MISVNCIAQGYYHVTRTAIFIKKDSLNYPYLNFSKYDSIQVSTYDGLARIRNNRITLTNGTNKIHAKIQRIDGELVFKNEDKVTKKTFNNGYEIENWNFENLCPTQLIIGKILTDKKFETGISVNIQNGIAEIELLPSLGSGIISVAQDGITNYSIYQIEHLVKLDKMNSTRLISKNVVKTLFFDDDGELFKPCSNPESYSLVGYLTEIQLKEIEQGLIGSWSTVKFIDNLSPAFDDMNKNFRFEINHDLKLKDLRYESEKIAYFGGDEDVWSFDGQLTISPSGKYLMLHNEERNTDNLIKYELKNGILTLELFPTQYRSTLKLTKN